MYNVLAYTSVYDCVCTRVYISREWFVAFLYSRNF